MPIIGSKRAALSAIRVPRQRELPQDLLLDPGTLLDDFENSADWTPANGTVANEPTTYKTGTQAILVTSAASGYVDIDKTVSWNLSRSEFIRLWVYPSTTAAVTFYLAATAWSKYMQGSSGALTANKWNLIQIPRGTFTYIGGMGWSDTITKIRLRWSAGAAGETRIYDGFYGNVYPIGAMAIAFDDGYNSVYDEAFRYARQTGVRATVFVITNLIGTSDLMSSDQLRYLNDHGWDIGQHTHTHPDLTTLTEAQQETEFTTAKSILDGIGLTRASAHIAYPYGSYNADSLTAMAATGMLTGRTIVDNRWKLPAISNYEYPAKEIINTVSLSTYKDLIKTAMDQRNILTVFMHKITATPGTSTEWAIRDWRALCDYIAMSGIPTITISELYALQSGAVTVPMAY